MNGTKTENPNMIRKIIFVPMCLLFIFIILMGIVSPTTFYNIESAISNFQYNWFGWLYALMAIVNIMLLAWLGFSKHGDIILGGKDAKPILSRWSWFTISLCGGIGTGIVFWGVAEPIFHLNQGVPGSGFTSGSPQAALEALSVCMLHWGLPSYAHYCIFGVAVGFAIYNIKLPYRISSTLYPLFGKKCFTMIGDIIDNICLFAIAVSVSAILAVASLQIGAGLFAMFKIEPNNIVRGIILLVVVSTFIISSYTGLQKGIRKLSDLNAKIFIGLLFFIFVAGHTRFSLFFTVEALGRSVAQFIPRMTYLSAIEGNQWPMWWTIIYWVWMIVYGPMVGLFLGKIAKGRSIREFIVMNLIVPSIFAIVWFGVFGSNAIKLELSSDGAIWKIIQSQGLEASVFSFLGNFPLPMVTSIGFMITLFLSVVTLCDSMTSTVASLSVNVPTSGDIPEPPNNIKIFWGLVMSSVAFLSIIATSSSTEGAIDMIQSTKLLPMTAALPVLFIYVALAASMIKMFSMRQAYDAAYFPTNYTTESVTEDDVVAVSA